MLVLTSGGVGPTNVALGPLIASFIAKNVVNSHLIGFGHLKEARNFRSGHIPDPGQFLL